MGNLSEAFKHGVEAFTCAAKAGHENFQNGNLANKHFGMAVAYFLLFLVVFTLFLILGVWLWNNIAVKYVTILKPVPGVLELLGLLVLTGMMFGGM